MKRIIGGITLLVMAAGSANAALLGRVPDTPGGTDYQAYYDDEIEITWLADANFARTSGYDSDGRMTWPRAQAWIASLNSANHLGANNWRLPNILDTGVPGCDYGFNGTDCGFNVDLSTGEMAHLYYSTLGNDAYYDTNGRVIGGPCWGLPYYCMLNVGPFSNLQSDYYWSGNKYPWYVSPNAAWAFYFYSGLQTAHTKNNFLYAWALRDGDIGNIGAVPAPGALWLFGTGLVALASKLRRRAGREAE